MLKQINYILEKGGRLVRVQGDHIAKALHVSDDCGRAIAVIVDIAAVFSILFGFTKCSEAHKKAYQEYLATLNK